ncbi:MAG: helix-turn-helix transcriptional regulator [Chitinophagaceae bacterium]|nr:helix-turn-helix transcriptional regulator [Oligoflexus sp.]
MSEYLGRLIQFHRKKSGMTQIELARLAGVGKTAVFDVEHGIKSPRFENLEKICKALNIKIQFESPLIQEFKGIDHEKG